MTLQYSWLPHNDASIAHWQLWRHFLNVYLHTECEQASGAAKTFPVFVKGSKRSNFLVNDVISKKPWHFLFFYLRRHWLLRVGSWMYCQGLVRKVLQIQISQKRLREHCSDALYLWKTFGFICVPRAFASFVCVEPDQMQSIPLVPQLPWSSRAAENRCCFIKVLAFHTGAHVLPKPLFTPALEVSTNQSQKHVLFQCQCWNMC